MAYRIEQNGYEFKGVKLGSKCIVDGEETMVIGFDEDDGDDPSFIAVISQVRDDLKLLQSGAVTVILEKYGDYYYDWVAPHEIKLIEDDEVNLTQSISQIHVADILEDVLQMDMTDPDEAYDIRCILNECIKSLRA